MEFGESGEEVVFLVKNWGRTRMGEITDDLILENLFV